MVDGGGASNARWAAVYKQNKGRLHAAAAKAVASIPDPSWTADDLVLDALIKAMNTDAAAVDSPVALILTIINNKAIDLGRRSKMAEKAIGKARRTDASSEAPAEDYALDTIEAQAVREAVEDLPEPQRHAIQQHIMNRRTAADVGAELGITGQAISQRCTKGITLLRKDPRILGLRQADDEHPGTAP